MYLHSSANWSGAVMRTPSSSLRSLAFFQYISVSSYKTLHPGKQHALTYAIPTWLLKFKGEYGNWRFADFVPLFQFHSVGSLPFTSLLPQCCQVFPGSHASWEEGRRKSCRWFQAKLIFNLMIFYILMPPNSFVFSFFSLLFGGREGLVMISSHRVPSVVCWWDTLLLGQGWNYPNHGVPAQVFYCRQAPGFRMPSPASPCTPSNICLFPHLVFKSYAQGWGFGLGFCVAAVMAAHRPKALSGMSLSCCTQAGPSAAMAA